MIKTKQRNIYPFHYLKVKKIYVLVISLKISKVLSESVNLRGDNTIVKRKRAEGRLMIYKTLHK